MHLRRKSGRYHWRRRVPLELVGRWGCDEIVKALATADREEAEGAARRLSVASDRLFKHVMVSHMLTADQISALGRQYLQDALEIDEEHRSLQRPTVARAVGDLDVTPVDADLEVLSDAMADTREALANNDFRPVQVAVEHLLTQRGIPVERRSPEYAALARMLLRAQVQYLRLAQARRVGDYALQADDPAFAGPAAPAAAVAFEPAGPLLSQIRDEYIKAKIRDGKWKPRTASTSTTKLKLFIETIGDKPVTAVTRDDIRDWRDALQDMELASNTIRLHFKVIAGLFNWIKEENKAKIDLSLRKLAPKGEESTREAFQPADLARLFSSPMYTGHWRADVRNRPGKVLVKDSKYWLPLVALHSGMRVEEIAKLKKADVREIDGVWCFDVYETKTEAGDRHVPVHPRLIALGLLEYQQGVDGARLWPDLQTGSEGKFSQYFVQWWAGFRHLIGIDRDGLVFHSFRHTFSGALQQAGVQEALVALLMGHRHPNLTFGRYGGKLITPRDKLRLVEPLVFGVNLEHLTRS